MAVYFCISSHLLSPFRTSHHVGFSDAIFSDIYDTHPTAKGEHYARNAQIYCGVATSSKGIKWPDPLGGDAALDCTEIMS